MELLDVTAGEQAGYCVHARLLLHWVNSLPLIKCLLVEELSDLRFGDVLLEIVEWLQSRNDAEAIFEDGLTEDDVFENGEIMERLRRVVQFVARECRSQDEDAMHIVNNAECVAQVLAGQSKAICAVLTVLKRLGVQRWKEQQSLASEQGALRRRQVHKEMLKLSLHSHDNAPQDKLDAESERKVKRIHSSSRPQPKTHLNTTKLSKCIREAGPVLNRTRETKRSRKRPATVPKRRQSTVSPSTTTVGSSTNISSKKIISKQTGIYHDNNGLRVYGMLDPTAKYQPRDELFDGKCSGCPPSDGEVAVRICNWVQLVLQIEIPMSQIFVNQTRLCSPRKIRQVFASGVLLCRIAAAILQRCGDQFDQVGIKTFPSVSEPQTPAERQRNLTLALTAFKRMGISPEAMNAFEDLQRPAKPVPSKTIWSALDEVFNRVERVAHAAAPSNAQHAHPETLRAHIKHKKTTTTGSNAEKEAATSPKHTKPPQLRRQNLAAVEVISPGCVPFKRNMPYVTSEQIHVVNEWLTRVGFDMKKSSGRGVLKDPMRNGVLFCSLLTQVLQKRSFSYIKRPRTLSDMRENISTAFIRLGDFPQEQIPPCFLTSSAEQAVLIGDRQINYGILWHLWQASHRTHVEGATTSPKGLDETRAVGVQAAVVPSPPMTSSPFLLDIPAIVLAEQGKVKASFHVKLHDSFARRLEWSANDPSGNLDDDDVFPVPRAPFSSPVYTVAVDSVSAPSQHETEEKYQDMDDILPAPSHNRNTDALSSPSHVSDNRAPRIEIEELSAYPDSAKSPTQASDSVSGMPSPAKKLETHGDQNFVPSQTSVEEILAWLKRLGIHLKKASTFHDSSAKPTEFQSGVLLCCIVEKVELMRSIPGITRPSGKNQLSKASALHNISKALAILQQKKTMPLHLLRRANAIYAGNREIILQLLLQIRKAYGHHHVPRRRSNQHSPAA
ncbi:hypothetical protein PRIC1_014908 [Phytophthora ramorum]